MEFLIRRTNGDWFSLHKQHFDTVLKPESIRAETCTGWGDHRIRIHNGEISFSFEEAGLHIFFEKFSGIKVEARRIVEEILKKMTEFSGETGEIIDL